MNVVSADPPCQTEIRKEKSAKQAYKWQQAEVTALSYLLVGLKARREIADQNFRWDEIIKLEKQIHETEQKLRREMRGERTARNNWKAANRAMRDCKSKAWRKCGCVVHHTQSQTDCNCRYKTWNGHCPCPQSPSQGRGGG